MRSLPLLLLFVLAMTTTAPPSSLISNRTLSNPQRLSDQPDTRYRKARIAPTLMEELLGPNGARRLLKAWNGKYLAARTHKCYTFHKSLNEDKYWIIEQINDNEVALRSSQGRYIKHDLFGRSGVASEANEWEMLTPVKNEEDGSWSFHSRWGKWLSAHREDNGKWFSFDRPYVVEFMPENKRCEHWRLESW